MKKPFGCIVSGIGVLLTLPLTILIILAVFGLTSLLGETLPGETRHFNLSNLGSLTINGQTVAPGWVTQLTFLAFAIAGIYLIRLVKRKNRLPSGTTEDKETQQSNGG